MALPPRTPPRFVPTLTEVVQTPDALPANFPETVLSRTTAVSPSAVATAHLSSMPATPAVSAASVPAVPPSIPLPLARHIPVATALEPRPAISSPLGGWQSVDAPLTRTHAAGPSAFPSHSPTSPQTAKPSLTPVISTTLAPISQGDSGSIRELPLVAMERKGAAAADTMRDRQLPEGLEENLVHRVMQRVDVVLDQRLRDAIATVVQEQTRSVLPRLREEIESVVRHAVYEAVADELATDSHLAPRS